MEATRCLSPASPEQMERLRKVEKERQKWDSSYITAEQARTIPQEVADADPILQARIIRSAEDWPERHLSAGEVFKDVQGGEGEVTERRSVEAESLFTGGPMAPKPAADS